MAYDSDRGVTVLFGGRPDLETEPTSNETWEYDGVTWRAVPITGGRPSPRELHAMAYDAVRKEVVMLGGYIDEQRLGGGTWTYRSDGTSGTWRQHFPNPEPVVAAHAMVYDSARQRVISHGGVDQVGIVPQFSFTSETYEWDGAVWQLTHSDGPNAESVTRAGHAMAYDSARGLTVLFGGFLRDSDFGTYGPGTWQYNNGLWIQAPGGTPALREGHTMAYDRRRNTIVMFGGKGPNLEELNDTYDYASGIGWTSSIDSSSGYHWYHAMVYDVRRGVTVVYGGSAGGFGTRDDTWELVDCCVCNEPGWVDFRYTGEEQGSFEKPYNTLAEGIANVTAGGTLKIKTGTTAERPPLMKAMTLVAYGGPVMIGR